MVFHKSEGIKMNLSSSSSLPRMRRSCGLCWLYYRKKKIASTGMMNELIQKLRCRGMLGASIKHSIKMLTTLFVWIIIFISYMFT
ncbi:hypothetical protein BRADI_1g36371v3 [Brachypodium distachyon]|uniref:Uncharacterized protein n=1 Tax=Brachypodium distachyon TaxID=15368 RepID=A0A2K2DN01_BRADI|nr:hypothetical protein BRADI_1g36371v3 [Brachypodium distachyon]